MIRTAILVFLAMFALTSGRATAEEGLWTFDNFPLARVNATYGTKLDQKWLDHLQGASVRLTSGCSGAIVSGEGLIFTNHHCIMECAQDLSDREQDYVTDGYMAARADERTCPGLMAEILTSVTDYTKEINAATAGLTGDAFVRAQSAAATGIEKKACDDDTRMHCEIVPLYQGGQYRLYKYRKYSDVRLVFAPEFQAAFFGGDPDNFNFPRYALDIGFLRIYENDAPVRTPDHLTWNTDTPREGDPVFVAGNPGTTKRLMTAAQLETLRDVVYPPVQMMKSELRGRLITFAGQDEENRRISQDAVFGVENGFKAMGAEWQALRDPAMIAAKRQEEAYLKSTLSGSFATEIGDPWAEIAEAQKAYTELFLPYNFLENTPYSSTLLNYARELVRGAAERQKPSAERLPEYADSRLPAIERDLFANAQVQKPLEQLYLEFRLSKAREYMGTDAPQTQILLGKSSPEQLAAFLVENTGLDNVDTRKALWEGGMTAIKASNDPMIQYALRIDPASRDIRRAYENRVAGPTRIAAEKIARVRFRAYGTNTYPDATWSLRLSYGRIQGWNWRGTTVTPFTYMKGIYDRATGKAPYQLPQSFIEARGKFDGNTVMDLVTTNDIVGGTSGSPAVNGQGEIVGAVFDGNIHSLGGAYFYDAAINRAVVVSTAAVSVALDKIYDNQALLTELRTN
ncbi:S46 family peptidase [Asticcacaulis taihuensis]|uniref:S46 family peptidase n=1 Tax=Asticcacaulis taihuensis TaxID=260084 RepID=UPI003F7C23F6